jgi:hypothetical protein
MELIVDCARCRITMNYLGKFPFRLDGMDGTASVFLGGLADVDERVINLDIYRCKKCRKIEIFDLNLDLTY